MKSKLINTLVVFLILAFATFLLFATQRADFNFDASYNMLPYQSLANGTGFNYQYGTLITPFNPPISTGPELYAPAALIWKVTQKTNYFTATYVLIAYFIAFLLFAAFYFFKKPSHRLAFVATFLTLFFLNKKIFSSRLYIDPIGEILATCLTFTGLYFLRQRKLLLSLILFAFALDTKTNIVVALLPVLTIFFFFNYLLPLIRQKKYKATLLKAGKIFLMSFIILLPCLTYTQIAPAFLLNDHEKMINSAAKKKWFHHQKSRGFGQLFILTAEFSRASIGQYFKKTGQKILILKGLYPGGYWMLLLIAFSFPLLLYFSRHHFTFYAFLFAGFFVLWWLFGTADPWYRYLFIPELIYSLSIAALLPKLAQEKDKRKLFATIILAGLIFIPHFSLAKIQERLRPEDRQNMISMQKLIQPIPQEQIFTYGWFQAPQLMILTNKRFMDCLDQEALEKAKKEYDQLYFVVTIENTLVQEEMDQIEPDLQLLKAFGPNKLYLIKK